jgi:hypothetical protein
MRFVKNLSVTIVAILLTGCGYVPLGFRHLPVAGKNVNAIRGCYEKRCFDKIKPGDETMNACVLSCDNDPQFNIQ